MYKQICSFANTAGNKHEWLTHWKVYLKATSLLFPLSVLLFVFTSLLKPSNFFFMCFSSSLSCSCQESSWDLGDLLNIRNSWYWRKKKKKPQRELQVNLQPMPYFTLICFWKTNLFSLIYSCFFLVRYLNLHRSKHGALWELQKFVNDLTPLHYCKAKHNS